MNPWISAPPLRTRPKKTRTFTHLSEREAAVIHFCYFKAKRTITQISRILNRSTRTVAAKVKSAELYLGERDYRRRSHGLKVHLASAFQFVCKNLAKRFQLFIQGRYGTIEEALEDDEPP